jgi:hypothetical protein
MQNDREFLKRQMGQQIPTNSILEARISELQTKKSDIEMPVKCAGTRRNQKKMLDSSVTQMRATIVRSQMSLSLLSTICSAWLKGCGEFPNATSFPWSNRRIGST